MTSEMKILCLDIDMWLHGLFGHLMVYLCTNVMLVKSKEGF